MVLGVGFGSGMRTVQLVPDEGRLGRDGLEAGDVGEIRGRWGRYRVSSRVRVRATWKRKASEPSGALGPKASLGSCVAWLGVGLGLGLVLGLG